MSFYKDLEYSHKDELLNEFYRSRGFNKIETITNQQLQNKGIDKIIWRDGKRYTVDEKKRRIDYGDFLIETVKNVEKNKLGWIHYTKSDYIIYWIESTNIVYAIKFKKLQDKFYKFNWEKTKPVKDTYLNVIYTTRNIVVKWEDLEGIYQKFDCNKLRVRA
jgi:hypothetical protein